MIGVKEAHIKKENFLSPYFKVCKKLSNSEFTEVVEKIIENWRIPSFPFVGNFKEHFPVIEIKKVDKKYFKNYPEPKGVLTGQDFSNGIKEIRKEFNL